MSDIRNCKNCGNMYTHAPGQAPLCKNCISIEEDEFRKVKDYLYDNPGSSLTQVANALKISTKKLTRYLREGRIEITGDSNMLLECVGCGKSIRTGRYCQDCEAELVKGLSDTGKAMSEKVAGEKSSDSDDKFTRGMKYLNKKV